MIKVVTSFIWIWVGVVVLVNIVVIIGMIRMAPSWLEAWLRVTDTYPLLNIGNFILEVILISPVIGAGFLLAKLQERADRKMRFTILRTPRLGKYGANPAHNPPSFGSRALKTGQDRSLPLR